MKRSAFAVRGRPRRDSRSPERGATVRCRRYVHPPQPQEPAMKLYGFPLSPNTWKARAVAAHLGLPLELEIVDLTKPRTPDYLAINPTGRTPTLVDGDFKLWESNAIMQYVASRSANALWPDNARTRADIARWQFWQLGHFS